MKSRHYSLEQRLVEPFRAIRSLQITPAVLVSSGLSFVLFLLAWWFGREGIFHIWSEILRLLIRFTDQPWQVSSGFWPEFAKPIVTLPKLIAAVPPPSVFIWWSATLVGVLLFFISGTWRPSFLPFRSTTRFILFLLSVSLACFAIRPMQFQHSVEEWSKIYFLGAYGSIVVYAIIWTCGVLWFPISNWVKLFASLLLLFYFFVGVPFLLFLSALALHYTSLLFLPLFALAFAPLLQLGWFIAFYSLALSSGADPTKEIAFE
jgi:hypothetical protein